MKRFIQDEHQGQSTLLPESLDDYVSDTNSVRVVDVFVNELDLVSLGFEKLNESPGLTDRPRCPLHDDSRYWNRRLQRADSGRY